MTTALPATNPNLVLVVDDEPMVREVLREYLTQDGFEVVEAADGSQAIETFTDQRPALILLDLMLPIMNGLDVLRRVRAIGDTPVILLTARGAESDRVAGLELGADDYVVKPFSPREVAARVRSVLRRSSGSTGGQTEITFGDCVVDLARRTVTSGGTAVDLTRKEFDLLSHFTSNPGQVIDRNRLLAEVWGSSEEWQDPSTVTVHVSRLRQKLEVDPSNPLHFVTVYGVGYRFES